MPILTAECFDSNRHDRVAIGIGKANTANALRKLADAVESGQCLPSRINLVQKINGDDFVSHVLLIEYTEMKEV